MTTRLEGEGLNQLGSNSPSVRIRDFTKFPLPYDLGSAHPSGPYRPLTGNHHPNKFGLRRPHQALPFGVTTVGKYARHLPGQWSPIRPTRPL